MVFTNTIIFENYNQLISTRP